jgi:tRNA 2-thiouridine synthesizing protein E
MALQLDKNTIETDKDGFLVHLEDWNEQVASLLATQEKIALDKAHWEIINLARQFYQNYQHSPEMRPLVKYTRQQLGDKKGSSLYLLSLFPGSPAKLACKIAGLPRPANCL